MTRSHLPDGRCVGWFGQEGVVIDAEDVTQTVPPALAARYGSERFWERWTAAECRAKAADVPIARWVRRHGLPSVAVTGTATHIVGDDVLVTVVRDDIPLDLEDDLACR